MIITIVPGAVTVDAGTATCASTLPMGTAMPGFNLICAAISGVNEPALAQRVDLGG
ncbi:MAG: hypothetical protein R2873_15680 [Caldilineaceae bacterium]